MYEQIARPMDRIRQAMTEAGMKQSELAKIADLNKGALSCWLQGRYEPKQEALYRIGKVLGVSEMWLAGYDVPKERPAEQRQNDLAAELVERMKNDPEYKSMLFKTINLTPDQVGILSRLIEQIVPPLESSTEG